LLTIFDSALSTVGLKHLLPHLDTAERWERRLSEGEKQNLTFARVLLQRPQWLVVNGALDELEPLARERMEALLAEHTAAGVINIGQDSAQHGFFTRKLRLVLDPHGPTFKPSDDPVILSA